MSRGKWIVFEGLDGSGTSTQAELLVQHLTNSFRDQHPKVVLTAEPTRSTIGKLCREYLREQHFFDEEVLALLFSADRLNHLRQPNGVGDCLGKGNWVVQDRYLYSTLAYQNGHQWPWLLEFSHRLPKPDYLFFLDTEPSECLKRIAQRGLASDHYENEQDLIKVRKNYLDLFELPNLANNLHPLDGNKPVAEIHQAVCSIVGGCLERVC